MYSCAVVGTIGYSLGAQISEGLTYTAGPAGAFFAVIAAVVVYLIKKQELYIVTLAPAIVCTLIAFAYILQAPEGLNLPSMTANVISIVATLIIAIIFIKKYR